ncbi:15156_t:CDS:2 [Entrophospora sp. SA101]|nr:1170_t:CDS:2 [Entrophospora sp. SA101]CAJ0760638.1 15156_t:CDS:2 [Entrophospora sp. SA101]CAJ0845395.1 20080_t:CDS:2 [Entrophospora sp. SA101]CAJ0924581.1 17824_t:CDS:2 [Entrophospora sp. SA101]
MPPPTSSMPATATNALTNDIDELSKQFGKKLASKFKKQFFVSINLPSDNTDNTILIFAEKKVLELIKEIFP